MNSELEFIRYPKSQGGQPNLRQACNLGYFDRYYNDHLITVEMAEWPGTHFRAQIYDKNYKEFNRCAGDTVADVIAEAKRIIDTNEYVPF